MVPGEAPVASRLPLTVLDDLGFTTEALWFLGLTQHGPTNNTQQSVTQDAPVFALDISGIEDPSAVDWNKHGATATAEFLDLRQVAALLPPSDGNVLAYARAMATWHRNHSHCGRCGAATTIESSGHLRRCPNCTFEIFPRTDPAVIMMVHDGGDRCLLGRQASWPEGIYSTLAGFVEPGESLEMAVAREVLEESGVVVTKVDYHSSQPWPFPTSIMLGFQAEAEYGPTNTAHDDELEDARWFSAKELRTLVDRKEVRLPSPMSISRRLVDHWLEEH